MFGGLPAPWKKSAAPQAPLFRGAARKKGVHRYAHCDGIFVLVVPLTWGSNKKIGLGLDSWSLALLNTWLW
jgi:hypothetical protein